MYSLAWHGDSFHNSVPPKPAMLSQNEISLMLACTNYWTNSQVTNDYTNVMRHEWCHHEFRITNMKFALVTRGSTHFQRDFEWDLRQAIFKLILVINGWNCAQMNVMGTYWSVYIGSDYYLNQCSQRNMSPYDVNGSQRLKIGRPYHIWTSFRVHFSWSILITITS